MIRITINKKRYKGVYRWDDITLQQFCELAAIPIPESYEAFILVEGKGFDSSIKESLNTYIESIAKITETDLTEVFPVYYKEVIKCLTNIPHPIIEKMLPDQVTDLYDYYFKPFVLSLIYHIPVIHFMGQIKQYTPDECNSFRVGLRKFYLPEIVKVNDQDIALKNEPVISYIEASDVFRGLKITRDDVKRLAFFMALYCRRKGEQYDEKLVLKRQELFMQVPMSVVWQVFFYTLRRMTELKQIIQLFGSLPKPIREVVHRAQVYKSMVAGDSFMNVPDTGDLEQSNKLNE
jgi:hypothetical protein